MEQIEKTINALLMIQQELKAPKNQYNKFGSYNYRNCEDILEAVKPLLAKAQAVLIVSDKPLLVGDWVFIEATATLTDMDGNSWSVTASAKHALDQKGMQDSQITGSTSSYARKYALNGLFAIDDSKDADSEDNTEVGNKTPHSESQKASGASELKATPKQIQAVQKIADEKGWGESILLEGFKVSSLADVTITKASEFINKYGKKEGGETPF